MAQVKMIVGMVGATSIAPGDIHQCSEAEATRLIEAGYAVAIAAPKKETATKKAVTETREG